MPVSGAGSSAGRADDLMDERIISSVELWMRAYPCRWREARGQELVDVVVDLAGPGARRLDARSAFDLVRGGWATRWREHPPLRTWLLYRLFGRRIPVAYRSWALDDIDGFWYPLRRNWPVYLALPPILVAGQPAGYGGMPVFVYVIWALVAVSSLFLWPEANRSRDRLKHVAPRPGERLDEGTFVECDVPRERLTARSTLTWAVLLLGITGAGSVVCAMFAPKAILLIPTRGADASWDIVVGPVGGRWVAAVAILMVALGAGVRGAAVARRRLDRLLGELPDQPDRVLRAIYAPVKAKVLFLATIIVALTWLEVSGILVLGLSQVLGTVALLLLPGALVAIEVTRRADAPDLAGSDVWRMATRGRLPSVDQPVRTLRPTSGPVPDGVAVQPRGPADPPHPATP
jgi:hypothetical protein